MLDTVRDALIEYVDVPRESITEATDFVQDLHMNSYDFVSLVGQLEEVLGAEVPDDDLAGISTVGELVAYLDTKAR